MEVTDDKEGDAKKTRQRDRWVEADRERHIEGK